MPSIAVVDNPNVKIFAERAGGRRFAFDFVEVVRSVFTGESFRSWCARVELRSGSLIISRRPDLRGHRRGIRARMNHHRLRFLFQRRLLFHH